LAHDGGALSARVTVHCTPPCKPGQARARSTRGS
jgi:hypothetical protein